MRFVAGPAAFLQLPHSDRGADEKHNAPNRETLPTRDAPPFHGDTVPEKCSIRTLRDGGNWPKSMFAVFKNSVPALGHHAEWEIGAGPWLLDLWGLSCASGAFD